MDTDNPFLNLLEKSTDDELFEIIENPDDSDKLLFEAAVTIARKRELISEFQATGLLEGDSTVMDYNPNNLEVQDIPYNEVIKPKKDIIPRDVKFKRYGVYLIVIGFLGLYLTIQVASRHFQLFNYIDYTLAVIAIIGGVAFIIRGIIIKKRYNKYQ
jgi:hypothetical protein